MENPYHNNLHAADVTCSMYHWFSSKLFKENMTFLDMFVSLIAAAAHDVGHDALTNQFHINACSKLATRYNDMAPLENYHASLSFELLHIIDNNWLQTFDLTSQNFVRNLFIRLILGTDSNLHQRHHENLLSLTDCVVLPKTVEDDTIQLRTEGVPLQNGELMDSRVECEPCEKEMILCAGLHLADIANPAKPNSMCVYWAEKVIQEFFEQGDQEKAKGLPVSPLCDRSTSNLEDGQIGFIKYVVEPVYTLWAKLIPESQIAVTYLKENENFWDGKRNSNFLRNMLARTSSMETLNDE